MSPFSPLSSSSSLLFITSTIMHCTTTTALLLCASTTTTVGKKANYLSLSLSLSLVRLSPFFHFSHFFLLLCGFVFVVQSLFKRCSSLRLLLLIFLWVGVYGSSCCCFLFCCSVSIAFIGFSTRIDGYLNEWTYMWMWMCVYAYTILILSTLFFTTNLLTIIRSLTRLLSRLSFLVLIFQ